MRNLIVLVALVAASACNLDTTTFKPSAVGNLAGIYNLQTVNGAPLPFTFKPNDTTTVNIDTDVMTLAENGAWGETINYRRTVGLAATTNESTSLSGVWTISGDQVNFRTSGGLLYIGTATTTMLSLADASTTLYVFSR